MTPSSRTWPRITDQAWLDQAGNFHGPEFHVVERYRMTGPDVIEYEARIDDPVVYTPPLDAAHGPATLKRPGGRIFEEQCWEKPTGCGIIFRLRIRATC